MGNDRCVPPLRIGLKQKWIDERKRKITIYHDLQNANEIINFKRC